MAGSLLYKNGKHWSRHPVTDIPPHISLNLIKNLRALTKYQIRKSDLTELLREVAWAYHLNFQATRRKAPIKADSERQLKAMLKLDSYELEKAIEHCDRDTRIVIAQAENALPAPLWMDVPSEVEGLVLQTYAAEDVRAAIQLALDQLRSQPSSRGPKEKPYQRRLVSACLKIWHRYYPLKAPGCNVFVSMIFDAAGMPLGEKSIEALLTEVRRGRIK